MTVRAIIAAASMAGACQSAPSTSPEVEAGSEESVSGSSSSTDDTTTGDEVAGDSSSSSGSAPQCSDGAQWVVLPGTPITVDGIVSENEWSDAAQFAIEPMEGWVADVGIKQDGDSLVFVFASFQSPAAPPAIVFPEIMLDVGNDKPTRLGVDDWWFHVSATDCAATGELDNYDGCVPEAEGWEANNFANGPIDLVEIRIDFATLGLDPVQQELGLLLRLSDTQGFATHWPSDADPLVPATWSTVRLCPGEG